MSLDATDTTCPRCGGTETETETCVTGLSLSWRCAGCKHVLAATGWLTRGPEMDEYVEVCDADDPARAPLLVGNVSAIWQAITNLTGPGVTLVLRPVPEPAVYDDTNDRPRSKRRGWKPRRGGGR